MPFSFRLPKTLLTLALCTQVLEYVAEPAQAGGEIHRVLKPGGVALLSLAALQPTVAQEEYWRFTGSGVRHLMTAFRRVEVVPEGTSISGFFRTCAVCAAMFARYRCARWFLTRSFLCLLCRPSPWRELSGAATCRRQLTRARVQKSN
jgi:hypothetical protein